MPHARAVAPRPPIEVLDGLRSRLEAARLDLLALFRALDQMDLSAAEIPQRFLQQLFHLDADYVEALWALDKQGRRFARQAMLQDTLASLQRLPGACAQFRKSLARRAHPTLESLEASIRKNLDPREAYNMVPGRDPQNC